MHVDEDMRMRASGRGAYNQASEKRALENARFY